MKKITAFSLAEMMIFLLIGSIALGFSAPMISKQIEHNKHTQTRGNILSKETTKVEEEIENILNYVDKEVWEEIEQLENKKPEIPSGAVMFFAANSCPTGWSLLTSKYPSAANSFIRDSGTTRALGSFQSSAMPNVSGFFHACDLRVVYEGPFYDTGGGANIGGYGGAGEYYYRK